MPLDEEIKSRWFVGLREFMNLNVIYFTTITGNKKVLQLILLFLIGMNLSVRGSLAWEEVEVPGGNPCVQAGNCDTLSHKTTVDHGDQTMITAVRREHSVHCTAWTTRGYTKGTSLAFFI